MTTATTNTVLDQSTDAAFRVWVAELITMLFTTLGMTQTADTGQINTSTVTRAASANTAAGYVIGRFNDTAQSTSPVFFKLEFGSGSTNSVPAMWMTVGTGSNGSGTLTGTLTGRNSIVGGNAISSTVTPYVTSGCYSAAAGSFGLSWKLGSSGSTPVGGGGVAIFRSADNTGAPTTDSVHLLTPGVNNGNGSAGGPCNMAVVSYLTGIAYSGAAAPFTGAGWLYLPFNVTVTLSGGNSQCGLVFQYTPVVGVCPWVAPVLASEWGLNATGALTIVGSTPHTYKNVGTMLGTSTGLGQQGFSSTVVNLVMLWE